jgi:hypothetical protein
MPRFADIASFYRQYAVLSEPTHDISSSFYVICLLMTRKKKRRQPKQEEAKATFLEKYAERVSGGFKQPAWHTGMILR